MPPLRLALLTGLSCVAAHAGDATLPGTCESLVIAGEDLTAACRGSLLRLEAPSFASFAFATGEGRTLSFTGAGIRDDAGTRVLPVTLVAPGLTNREGISRSPTPADGACRITPDAAGDGTRIDCDATAQGKRYAGRFRAREAAAKP